MNNILQEKIISKNELDKEINYLEENPYDMTGTGQYIDNDLKDFLIENLSEAIEYYNDTITAKKSDKVPLVKDEYEEYVESINNYYL